MSAVSLSEVLTLIGGQQVSENRNSLARLCPSYLEDEYRSTLLFQQLFLSFARLLFEGAHTPLIFFNFPILAQVF